jgi:competence protein ComEA
LCSEKTGQYRSEINLEKHSHLRVFFCWQSIKKISVYLSEIQEMEEKERSQILGGEDVEKNEKRRWIAAFLVGCAILGISLYNGTRNTLPQVGENTLPQNELNVIYVSGAVNHPGVVKISGGLRIIDAINAAGGLSPEADASKINMAQALKDGMQILVPAQNKVTVETAGKSTVLDGQRQGNKININSAAKQELDQLPGVGAAMAERIIEYRNNHGGFRNLEDLKKVNGIGEAKFEKIKDKISL